MTEAIQAIRTIVPHAFRSRSLRLWHRAAAALRASVRAHVIRRRVTTLRVSDSWLRENEAAAGKRQEL